MEFRLLGPLEAEDAGQRLSLGGRQRKTLLALLLVRAGEPVSTDHLIQELWGDDQPPTARRTVQAHVAHLRKVLNRDDEVLAGVGDGYVLQVDPHSIDVQRFEEMVDEGRHLLDDDPEAASDILDASLRLFHGAPLSGVADDAFTLRIEADRLEELRLGAVETRLQAGLAAGHVNETVAEAQRVVAEHPLREGAWAVLMLALYRSGRQAEALRAFSKVRRLLAEELGIEPSGELRELEQRLLDQDPTLEQEVVPTLATTSRSDTSGEPDRLLIGRESEMGEMLAALDNARSGHGSLFLMGGEPGIGKSRLAEEVTLRARELGVTVLWGSCWEGGGAPAYWPWVQVLRSYMRIIDEAQIHEEIGAGAVDMAQMLPELNDVFPDLGSPASMDPESARFRLFDSTTTFLMNASAHQPLLVVIDDIHAADRASILLLRFVVGQVSGMSILLLATYRDVELGPDDPLTIPILDLERDPATRHLVLKGLSGPEVARLIESTAGVTPQTALVAALHHQTGGNPLFVAEAIRLLATEGDLSAEAGTSALRVAIPQAVRDVIMRRITHLSEGGRRILTTASVLGPEFNFETLRRLSDISADELSDAIDEAARAGLVVELAGQLGRFRFYHDLVREALYEAIPPGERARLHLAAGSVLESMYEADQEPHLADIAHHYFESASIGETAKAVEYTRRAAEHAARQLAYEDAITLYDMALQAAELADSIESTTRCDLLLGLGDVQARSGDLPAARQTLRRAYDIARRIGEGRRAAQAALGYGGRFAWERAGDDPHLVPMLQDALALLGGEDDRTRVRLLSRLACALRDSPDRERSASLSGQALALARTLSDPTTLAYALEAHIFSVWWPENPQERLDLATDLVALATETHDGELIAGGHVARYVALMELGATIAAETEIEKLNRVAHAIRQPGHLWAGKSLRAVVLLLEGRFVEAEPLIEEALHAGQPSAVRDDVSAGRCQMFLLRREQDRVGETEPLIRASVDEFPWYPLHRSALACLLLDLGRITEARVVFDQLATEDFAIFNRDNEWLLGMSLAAEACSMLEDRNAADVLYEQLLPFVGRHAVGIPEGSIGAVDRYLGLLAALLGRSDQAERHFEEAIALNKRMGARPWVAHSQHDLAQLLFTQRRPEDRQRAVDLIDESLTAAREIEMTALTMRIEETSAEEIT